MRLSALFAPAIAAVSLGVSGCISNSLSDFQEADRTLRLEEYFLGETTAYGIFEDRFGKIRRQFTVDITGTLKGDTLTLVEDFDYSDGVTDTRTWTIDVLGDGKYRGTANDVPGIAEGQAVGNAFNWQYKAELKVDGDTWTVGFDDWMYLLEDGVLINRAYVTRFGIRIGEVTISFQKGSRGGRS
ncbi:DUF3833 domain-containing protein [Henriciella sp.]|uniref:DUF3833 domain-containing protein n=1 Tax=Henriciella sp. TaxID=1968823 RepID=UPI00262A7E5C|nr:DUF3833 domain-containing protein [Henriciella sp.]